MFTYADWRATVYGGNRYDKVPDSCCKTEEYACGFKFKDEATLNKMVSRVLLLHVKEIFASFSLEIAANYQTPIKVWESLVSSIQTNCWIFNISPFFIYETFPEKCGRPYKIEAFSVEWRAGGGTCPQTSLVTNTFGAQVTLSSAPTLNDRYHSIATMGQITFIFTVLGPSLNVPI